MKDYYKTLGVNKSATKDEIKKAFYKLAHQHHPDKNGGDDKKFKEVNEAYQILSDEKKRAHYDKFGTGPGANTSSGFNYGGQGNPFEGFDFSGFGGGQGNASWQFDFGDMGDIFDMFGGGQGRTKKRRGDDLQVLVEITFSESYLGTKKTINFNRHANCETCSGTGAKPGTKINECKKCNGKGVTVLQKKTIFGVINQQSICPDCDGEGKIPDQRCSDCKGAGVKMKKEVVEVTIPEGIEKGQQILVRGYGESIKNGQSGDLYVIVQIKKSKHLSKKAKELLEELKKEGL